MGKKYVMTGSFLDGFKASFTKKECILAEKHYPLGYFAVEFLEVDRTLLRELERLVPIFQEELTVFLSARDPSSAALAQQALNEDDKSLPEPELPQFSFPLQVSFKAVTDASGKWGFAEQIEFEELSSFLHYDLCHGMSAGNIPRRCECCGHYFLAIGAYDTRYCMRIAPGETVKTCRQVGAHRKEKQRNGTEFVRKEYQKVYNRLRGRKNRGIISVDEWNQQVAEAQELKAQAIAGNIDDVELKRQFEKM